MTTPSRQAEYHSGLQNQVGIEFMSNPQAPLSRPYYPEPQNLQTQAYQPDDKDVIGWVSAFEQYFSWLDYAQQQIEEIRQEAMEASALDNEIDRIPDSAYDDAHSLLKMLFQCNVPMPDIGWAEDGSLGFEWRPENGIATMSLYGDNHVIYGAFFNDKRQVEGVCALSDTAMLRGFLTLLNLLL